MEKRRFLKKLKTELPYDPEIPFLGIYPEKNIAQKGTCTPVFIAVLFSVTKTWKQSKCPWTDNGLKSCGVCVCVYIYRLSRWC